MTTKPNKWIAAVLGFLAPPLAMMYVARIGWAASYLLLALTLGITAEFYFHDVAGLVLVQLIFLSGCVTHAYRLASRAPDAQSRPGYSRWYGLCGAGLLFLGVTFGIRAFLVEPFRAPSSSMLPTIPVGAHLIVQKWGYGNYGSFGLNLSHTAISAPLKRGDIIVFEFPQNRSIDYVKRLIGLPGDKVAYRGKRLFINGLPVPTHDDGNYLDWASMNSFRRFGESLDGVEYSILSDQHFPAGFPPGRDFPLREQCTFDAEGMSCEVPPRHYFTLGDNRDHSADSRIWGFVPAELVVGRVIRILP
jgi:signal peptidase I